MGVREEEEEITLWIILAAFLTVEVTLLLGLLDDAASDIRPRQSSVYLERVVIVDSLRG